jgi:lactose/L-arabinose transport system ATP-binding protein
MNFMDDVLGEGGVANVPALQQEIATGVSGAAGTKVSFGVRPEHLTMDPTGTSHKVDMTESLGGVSYAYLISETGERLIVEGRGDELSREGDVVGLSFEHSRSYVFDAQSDARIR